MRSSYETGYLSTPSVGSSKEGKNFYLNFSVPDKKSYDLPSSPKKWSALSYVNSTRSYWIQ